MKKLWGVLLFISAISWIIDLVALIATGETPDNFSIGVALFITTCAVLKWAYEAFFEDEL